MWFVSAKLQEAQLQLPHCITWWWLESEGGFTGVVHDITCSTISSMTVQAFYNIQNTLPNTSACGWKNKAHLLRLFVPLCDPHKQPGVCDFTVSLLFNTELRSASWNLSTSCHSTPCLTTSPGAHLKWMKYRSLCLVAPACASSQSPRRRHICSCCLWCRLNNFISCLYSSSAASELYLDLHSASCIIKPWPLLLGMHFILIDGGMPRLAEDVQDAKLIGRSQPWSRAEPWLELILKSCTVSSQEAMASMFMPFSSTKYFTEWLHVEFVMYSGADWWYAMHKISPLL